MSPSFAALVAAAATENNLPTAIAIISAVAAIVAGLASSWAVFSQNRANKRKLEAQASNESATADKTRSEVPFAGGAFVKEISDAAASLVTPLRLQNEQLQKEVDSLRERVELLEEAEREARRDLHNEREVNATAKKNFTERLGSVSQKYQEEIAVLKAKIVELEARIGREEGPNSG